jgi:monovalent cation/proton antiporter MnhG/PhaG subunit
MSAREIVVDVFLILGVVLALIACVGVLVFRNVFERLHFSSPAVLASVCVAVAVVTKESFSLVGDKAILVAAILLVGAPLLTHAIGRAARTAAHGDWKLRPEESIEVREPPR